MSQENAEEQDGRKVSVLTKLQYLCMSLDGQSPDNTTKRLMSSLKVIKALEQIELEIQSSFENEYGSTETALKADCRIAGKNEASKHCEGSNPSLCNSIEEINTAKIELGCILREILLLKRKIDAMPSQTELVQYERRFSELYIQIQEKHQQTLRYYATYNALMEIKELMLKEISLLNSIDSQFQTAMSNKTGQAKVINSLEDILKGTKQKLEKLQSVFDAEQKNRDTLKEKYAEARVVEGKLSSLVKDFQEECSRNERLRKQISM